MIVAGVPRWDDLGGKGETANQGEKFPFRWPHACSAAWKASSLSGGREPVHAMESRMMLSILRCFAGPTTLPAPSETGMPRFSNTIRMVRFLKSHRPDTNRRSSAFDKLNEVSINCCTFFLSSSAVPENTKKAGPSMNNRNRAIIFATSIPARHL